MTRMHQRIAATVCLLAACGLATPAAADVKAGVDAWAAGDFGRAVNEWRGPATAGDADAQFNLAQAYRLGRGVEVDLARAEFLYGQAAAQGHLQAADKYGLILFQNGKREAAMPYIEAAAGRGDPQAQYLLGIAHFNGDYAPKDWPRAYALLTLANSAGMSQAPAALAQMDQHIPMEQRQLAQSLASTMKMEAEAARARELAAVDLALAQPKPTPAQPRPVQQSQPAARPTPPPAPRPAPARQTSGPWKVQLGSFGVAGNSDRLWRKLSSRPELAGRQKVETRSGNLTVLSAGGFASRSEASQACAALKRSGQDCLVKR